MATVISIFNHKDSNNSKAKPIFTFTSESHALPYVQEDGITSFSGFISKDDDGNEIKDILICRVNSIVTVFDVFKTHPESSTGLPHSRCYVSIYVTPVADELAAKFNLPTKS